jgi:glutamate-5-semialdehyde dehydrogenase
MGSLETIGKEAKEASYFLGRADSIRKDSALRRISKDLERNAARIIKANEQDVSAAIEKGRGEAFIDRLSLDGERIGKMAASVMRVAELPDPVGATIKKWQRPNGLEIEKIRVPIGVIGIIYEARPDVGAEASSLCLKSGSCVILRGGSDAYNSNKAVSDIIRMSLESEDFPPSCVQMLDDTSHEAVLELLRMKSFIDLIIPRGGEVLIEMVSENSLIPVIKHYKGVCHVYVDSEADLKLAEDICFNAKVQRPSVCNAMETMLVHRDAAGKFLPGMLERFKDSGVEIRGDESVKTDFPWVKAASEEDWGREFLSLVLAVKTVSSLGEAVSHINALGSHHSDAIVTSNYNNAREFLRAVDSAAVYLNASTRFTDGGEFGFGAEMGISTDKLHARGPMALEELTSYKYIVYGTGQIRE